VESSSRIAEARRRVRLARYALGTVAVAGLAVFGVAVRDAHPATHHPVQPAENDDSASTFSFGGSSLDGAGSAAPTIQSGGS
jgi:hypothetical protein